MAKVFKVIPGYEGYAVNSVGEIINVKTGRSIKQYLFNGYFIVDAFYNAHTETLPVHRAVALAWLDTPADESFKVVNHVDGVKTNNAVSNLEWSTFSLNNYHAVNNGLRNDNIACKLRNIVSGEITFFNSVSQCLGFLGLKKNIPRGSLMTRCFGQLYSDKYELRIAGDLAPWFYVDNDIPIKPVRNRIKVNNDFYYDSKSLLVDYPLCGKESSSSIELVENGNMHYSPTMFVLQDIGIYGSKRMRRGTELSVRMQIVARKNGKKIVFSSLSRCARHFNKDRSSIKSRLGNMKELDGWTFSLSDKPALQVTGECDPL